MAEDMTPVVLVDRAMLGGFEFPFDGRPRVFKKGAMKLVSFVDCARFVFTRDAVKVWTKDGRFVHRVGLEDAPGYEGIAASLANDLGAEILDTDPIELDTERLENWSMEGADRSTGSYAIKKINVSPQELLERAVTASDRLVHTER